MLSKASAAVLPFSIKAMRRERIEQAARCFEAGLTYRQMAERLEISTTSVHKRLTRAREAGRLPPLTRIISVHPPMAALKRLQAAAEDRGLTLQQLTERLLTSASECVDAVLDDR